MFGGDVFQLPTCRYECARPHWKMHLSFWVQLYNPWLYPHSADSRGSIFPSLHYHYLWLWATPLTSELASFCDQVKGVRVLISSVCSIHLLSSFRHYDKGKAALHGIVYKEGSLLCVWCVHVCMCEWGASECVESKEVFKCLLLLP